MVKLLAGNFRVDVNVKSHGGYTPLHLACQYGHQEVFDLLVKAYGADPRVRDNAGKTPRQYMMAHEQASMGTLSMSNDMFRQLKDRRRNRRQVSAAKQTFTLHPADYLNLICFSTKW
jgi:ankyrin repeat protein